MKKTTNKNETKKKNKTKTTNAVCGTIEVNTAPKMNPFSQSVDEILELVEELDDESLLLGDYGEFILGYDTKTNALIYDGLGIINKIMNENMEEDERTGTVDGEWEDYYDRAADWVCGGLSKSAFNRKNKTSKVIEGTEEKIFPIIMMRFLTK